MRVTALGAPAAAGTGRAGLTRLSGWSFLVWLCLPWSAQAQDMSTLALLLPRSGCALSAAETVRVRIINHGSMLPGASIFSLSYTIDGGTPVSETIFMGNSVPPNGMFTYTFINPADLSQPGVHQIDASITVTGDTNPANDALGAQAVQNWAAPVGGSVTAPPGPTAAGTLTLAGHLGTVAEWQQSVDGARWRALENATDTQSFSVLSQPTLFRALVRNGPCPPALSSAAQAIPNDIFSNGFEP